MVFDFKNPKIIPVEVNFCIRLYYYHISVKFIKNLGFSSSHIAPSGFACGCLWMPCDKGT